MVSEVSIHGHCALLWAGGRTVDGEGSMWQRKSVYNMAAQKHREEARVPISPSRAQPRDLTSFH
jgi:hypothetical protein